MTEITFPGAFRPGAPTVPQPTPEWYLKFLAAEERETAVLMGFFQQARLELETFIREGDLTMSDARFYRDLLAETNRIASNVNEHGATWASSVIPEAYVAGRMLTSSVVVNEKALQALANDPLRLITDTSDMMRRRVRQAVSQGILQGLSGSELRARIIQTGLTNIPRWPSIEYRAGVIARTETMKAFNAGNLNGITETGAKFVRWIASPDEATCPICLPRDGVVFRISGEPGENDPYPAAQPFPGVPAHPRCRCTMRAEYRDPDGNVIREGVTPPVPVDPKLSAGTMGADEKPVMPPAVGDFEKAVGGLKGFKADYLAGKDVSATRSFWRNLSKLDDDQIKAIARLKGGDYMDGYLLARWGARFTGSNWPENAKFYTIRALERIHGLDPAYLKDSPFLRFIGKPPTGRRLGGSAIAACWPSGEIGVSMTKWSSYLNGKALRGGPGVNAGEEVILHEFMHALHNEHGLSSTLRHFGAQQGTYLYDSVRAAPGGLEKDSFRSAWKAIDTRREIAPDASKIDDYEAAISNYQGSIDSVRKYEGDSSPRIALYEGLIAKYEAKIAEIRASKGAEGGPDYYPTEYAQRGGYAEDFAESAMLYFLAPAKLKTWSPGRYRFIRDMIARGQEF